MVTRKAVTKRGDVSSNGVDPDIIFEDAPPSTRGSHRRSKHLKHLEAARANPGRTVKIPNTNTSVAANIRAGKYKGVAKGEFHVETRQVESVEGKPRVDVYVTFPPKKTKR
jgi:hypothetical protein